MADETGTATSDEENPGGGATGREGAPAQGIRAGWLLFFGWIILLAINLARVTILGEGLAAREGSGSTLAVPWLLVSLAVAWAFCCGRYSWLIARPSHRRADSWIWIVPTVVLTWALFFDAVGLSVAVLAAVLYVVGHWSGARFHGARF